MLSIVLLVVLVVMLLLLVLLVLLVQQYCQTSSRAYYACSSSHSSSTQQYQYSTAQCTALFPQCSFLQFFMLLLYVCSVYVVLNLYYYTQITILYSQVGINIIIHVCIKVGPYSTHMIIITIMLVVPSTSSLLIAATLVGLLAVLQPICCVIYCYDVANLQQRNALSHGFVLFLYFCTGQHSLHPQVAACTVELMVVKSKPSQALLLGNTFAYYCVLISLGLFIIAYKYY